VDVPSTPSAVPYELDARLRVLVRNGELALPPYPAVALQLSRVIRGDDYSLSDLAKIVESDAVLSATVLRYAQSPAMRGRHAVRNLDQALGRLGSQRLLRLAYAASLSAEARSRGVLQVLRREAWRRALYGAEICRVLAPVARVDEGEAHLAGLLHDFGQLVALGAIERILAGHAEAKVSRQMCRHVADLYHVELGGLLAESWKLPEPVQRAIRTHHRQDDDPLVTLVRLADGVVARIEGHLPVRAILQDSPFPATARVLLEELLPTLPAILAAFEPGVRRDPPTTLEVAEPLLGEDAALCRFRVVAGGRKLRGLRMGLAAMEVRGSALPEQAVIQVGVDRPPHAGLDLWVLVARQVKIGPREAVMELVPCAMDEETEARWRALADDQTTPRASRAQR
jgi:HD-like signal output (HDOD) protein